MTLVVNIPQKHLTERQRETSRRIVWTFDTVNIVDVRVANVRFKETRPPADAVEPKKKETNILSKPEQVPQGGG